MAQQIEANNLAFVREVARYFMDFLETDFHKRRNPKRSIQLRNSSNLLVGINLAKYPSFANIAWKTLGQGFSAAVTVFRSAHRTPVPAHLLDTVRIRAKVLYQQEGEKLFGLADKAIRNVLKDAGKDYEKALGDSLKCLSTIISEKIANPLILENRSSLERLGIGDEASMAMLTEELCSVLTSQAESAVAGIVKTHVSGEEANILLEMTKALSAHESMTSILTFFEGLQVADLYTEILEMERNRNILDKYDFYLYFCDITYDGTKYPIFYIPFIVSKIEGEISLEFGSQVYLNKKALEFIAQEYNKEEEKRGNLHSTGERIIYLANCGDGFRNFARNVIDELTDFFGLNTRIDLADSRPQLVKGSRVRVSNACYVALFEKSDEALVNDYEEILNLLAEGGGILSGAFEKLIGDAIHNDPVFINMEVEEEWDRKIASDKLVFKSPIPLNSEQLQILAALQKDGCRYVTVEGPPGTGKSHTITAVVFDAIMNARSVLVLSDKKEALDVVEDKITETLNRVRLDRNFQNPILRLGRAGAVLSNAAVDAIRTQYRATRNEYKTIEQNVITLSDQLRAKLKTEIHACSDLTLQEILRHRDLEALLTELGLLEHIGEIKDTISQDALWEYLNTLEQIGKAVRTDFTVLEVLGGPPTKIKTLSYFKIFLTELGVLTKEINDIRPENEKGLSQLKRFKQFSEGHLKELDALINEFRALKHSLFGYLFKGKKLKEVNGRFRKAMKCKGYDKPHRCINELKTLSESVWNICSLRQQHPTFVLTRGADLATFIHRVSRDEKFLPAIDNLTGLLCLYCNIDYAQSKFPNIIAKTGIGPDIFEKLLDVRCLEIPRNLIKTAVEYAKLDAKVNPVLLNAHEVNYVDKKREIEDLATLQMTYIMDGRAVDFFDQKRATAAALRSIIKAKQRFPREEFKLLKEAFPCILAGIRDYAEYIPLEPEMFDLVIIDEASQVSIAQSLPALLRAKKVLILGDRKQFSNVKTSQARTDTNREYLNRLKSIFTKNVSDSQTKLERMGKFNIKTSILEFFEFIANYRSLLLKHFRGYKEHISYSNKNFYDNKLQVMKIRGKAADEVLKFTIIKHDGKSEPVPNTNVPEIEFIVSELRSMSESGSKASVGIITPHTNQQKKLMETLSAQPEKDYWFDELNLKIMTFDTCQGEERDIVYYSMVATDTSDRLGYVFIKDLSSVNLEDDSVIRAQRLNVGFSRVRERMHFVLSKPPEGFSGAVGEAIRHYQQALRDAKKERGPGETDPRSFMEPVVLNWFYQTDFWKRHRESVEIFPQFELGKYLKQLDNGYNHPAYKVDFLLLCRDAGNGSTNRVVIEYDGFLEHFSGGNGGADLGRQVYYSEADIYRQKVLESYGYKFLRLNKFNVGRDPISTLSRRLGELIKFKSTGNSKVNDIVDRIHETAEGLQNGEMKVCPKCGQTRILDEFRDKALATGYGRYCRKCKGIK